MDDWHTTEDEEQNNSQTILLLTLSSLNHAAAMLIDEHGKMLRRQFLQSRALPQHNAIVNDWKVVSSEALDGVDPWPWSALP